jgi:hypothetical protein
MQKTLVLTIRSSWKPLCATYSCHHFLSSW